MKASDFIVDLLLENNVDKGWYVQGGAISHVIDSAHCREVETGDFKAIFVQHEQAAGFAADAYSRCGSKIGAVFVTSGPGATNVMTSIASSWYDGVPVIYITGQVRTWESSDGVQRQKGFQETDIISMTQGITKYSTTVSEPRLLKYEMQKAISMATTGRPGPVVIDLPMNVQWADLDFDLMIDFQQLNDQYPDKDERAIRKIGYIDQLLSQADRPVILVGGGVNKQIANLIHEYSETREIPIVTSFSGKHFFADEIETNFGFIGTMGMHTANEILHRSDVALVIGSRLSWRQIRSDPINFARDSKIVHVDIDKSELNANLEAYLTVNVDATYFCNALSKLSTNHKSRIDYLTRCKALSLEYSYLPTKTDGSQNRQPHTVIAKISKFAGDNTIFCLDTGQNLIWAIQGLESLGRRQFISSWGHSPMGYAICAALGAAELNERPEVVCIIGDGGIQMNIQELQTLYLNNYNVKVFVINNNSLGAIKEFQDDNLGARHVGTGSGIDYQSPNMTKIGKAYGIRSINVSHSTNIDECLTIAFSSPDPCLINIEVDEEAKMVLSLEQYF
jgi:acetolactate synthase I/II/III large subunit